MHLNELQVVQNTALRLNLNEPRYDSLRHLHADFDISPIHNKIRELVSSFFQSNNPIAQAANFTPGLHRHLATSENLLDIF
ncbi:hypothetical protein TNIN_72101 [Trichonephila inaurata madagascariensis]|uniref:Uncharacterized protein n=1 Tax=Trichonephila inaurata madagascariensis TaxID=2747483 RepID=A0A8X7C5I8_9ARAC|nr:hypothetical protein TNIN_72101 [Trichonephila inaurata madagascariensis]